MAGRAAAPVEKALGAQLALALWAALLRAALLRAALMRAALMRVLPVVRCYRYRPGTCGITARGACALPQAQHRRMIVKKRHDTENRSTPDLRLRMRENVQSQAGCEFNDLQEVRSAPGLRLSARTGLSVPRGSCRRRR